MWSTVMDRKWETLLFILTVLDLLIAMVFVTTGHIVLGVISSGFALTAALVGYHFPTVDTFLSSPSIRLPKIEE